MSFLQRGLRLTIRQTAGLRAVKASPAMSLKHRLLSTSANARARPLVSDVIANVTFVNYKGERQTLAGLEGQSLVEVCSSHDKEEILEDDGAGGGMSSQIVQSETWTEDVYGEGATSNQSHVIIPPEWYAKLPEPTPQESDLLKDLDNRTPNSRLGSEIRLTKELDGLVVYVPDPYPCDMP
mmetsp:Transcript_5005/g.6318  ORF Transcript_5005/g.6318 Transcript_5005/m.6318 type:complete len:181 (+) Transcript_5005:459-1001(+)|eukprot:CAMPEP_0204878220 /NCGR_PEP_ID=MMETSP1348-20121228/48626_1 /ASSEMBLY_ACC=CAM_ASM_000700 /TAXON_ID=215587 /ORGANISM="Aplanochytrium stocchinoi, Strain GSBS06" /LENGTH=180 /DNA_ID=CAMNT_0052035179 /DNA_START=306 /DNA_END=848 /DNA_ORIENTATION=+